MSELVEDNASTTETDENKVSEEVEDIEDEEGIDGVSSEGEKTSGGTETVEVGSSNHCSMNKIIFLIIIECTLFDFRLKKKVVKLK